MEVGQQLVGIDVLLHRVGPGDCGQQVPVPVAIALVLLFSLGIHSRGLVVDYLPPMYKGVTQSSVWEE